MNSEAIWLYWDKQRHGPFELKVIHNMLAAGTIPQTAKYHDAPLNAWKPISELPPATPPPRPIPPTDDAEDLQERWWKPTGELARAPWIIRQISVDSLIVVLNLLATTALRQHHTATGLSFSIIGLIASIFGVFNDLKRWRDIDKSPWWELTILIPFGAPLMGIFLLATSSEGPAPKPNWKTEATYAATFVMVALIIGSVGGASIDKLLPTPTPVWPTASKTPRPKKCKPLSELLEGTENEITVLTEAKQPAISQAPQRPPQQPNRAYMEAQKEAVAQTVEAIRRTTVQTLDLCRDFAAEKDPLQPEHATAYATKFGGLAKTAKFQLAGLIAAENRLIEIQPKTSNVPTAHNTDDLHKLQARYCDYIEEMAQLLVNPALGDSTRTKETGRLNQEIILMDGRIKSAQPVTK